MSSSSHNPRGLRSGFGKRGAPSAGSLQPTVSLPDIGVQVVEQRSVSSSLFISLDDDTHGNQDAFSRSIDRLDYLIAHKARGASNRRPIKRAPIPPRQLKQKMKPQNVIQRLPPALQFAAREERRKKKDRLDAER